MSGGRLRVRITATGPLARGRLVGNEILYRHLPPLLRLWAVCLLSQGQTATVARTSPQSPSEGSCENCAMLTL